MRFTTIIMLMILIENSISAQIESHHHDDQQGIVFSGFPYHSEDYSEDVRAMMDDALIKYGAEEFRLIVLTCELHGHLGIYAILGAKMGLYAREVLNAPPDELSINSFAGLKPPVSCLNDGLQVSTGATLGHGLISVQETDSPVPSAEFSYKEQTIKITLKADVQQTIAQQIKLTIEQSGGLTPSYWQKIRDLGLKTWLEYDRKEIFQIETN